MPEDTGKKYISKLFLKGTSYYLKDTEGRTLIEALDKRIDELPAPMQFKGTLGEGGTITELPAPSENERGHTYKVIKNGTYATIIAEVGDVFVCNGAEWILIPSGDEPEGTVTNIAVGSGLTTDIPKNPDEPTGEKGGPITASGTISLAQSGVIEGTYIGLTVDKYGRVTAAENAIVDNLTTETTNQVLSANQGKVLDGKKQDKLTAGDHITIDDTNKISANYSVVTDDVDGLMSPTMYSKLEALSTTLDGVDLSDYAKKTYVNDQINSAIGKVIVADY